MRGRKPQPLPSANAYAMIPQFMYVLLGTGAITPAAFAVWATIRLFARDQVRNTFSPGPVALTTAQLAQLLNFSETHIKNLVCELENIGALKRQLAGNSRQLQLCAPAITGHSIYPSLHLPVNNKEEDIIALDNNLEATPPPEALSREGGMGGGNHQSPYLPVNELSGNSVPFDKPSGGPNQSSQPASGKPAIVALLRERGAFPRVADAIADVLISNGITDLVEVRDLVNAVIRQVVAEGAKEHQVIARAMVRLRDGDWDIAALRDEAIAAAQYDNTQYTGAALPPAAPSVAVLPPAAPSVAVPTSFPVTRADEGRDIWRMALDVMRNSTTAAIFDTWLSRTQALGFNGDGETLVVMAFNQQAVEILSERILPLVQRSLRQAAGREVPVHFVCEDDL